MARRSRSDTPGSWHHVINRGLAKRALFESRDDARFFLSRMVEQIRLGRIELHAYCLLTTHFHLLLKSPTGELSEVMRRVQNEYSRRFNRNHRRDGSLVRGRFFSRVVESLEYRRTVVRYIDANPVKAGLVKAVGDYELTSAASYLHGSGPRWLNRTWVESEACRVTASDRYTPTVYRRAFGFDGGLAGTARVEATSELVEARLARPPGPDPLDDLVAMAPAEVQAWMQRKAELADGHRVGLPLCGPRNLERAIEAHLDRRGTWMVEDGPRTWRGAELARVGLSRDLCASTWREIESAGVASISRARHMAKAHHRLLRSDSNYADRITDVVLRSRHTESHTLPRSSDSSVPHKR